MSLNEETFLEQVKDHQMTVIRDDGEYRHVRFRKPNTNNMFFDLVAFPGTLVFTGDMGTYTFSRERDMFRFFHVRPDDTLTRSIDKRYWGEKMTAICKNGDYREYQPSVARESVKYRFDNWCEDQGQPDEDASEQEKLAWEDRKTALWAEITREVLRHVDDEHEFWEAVREFTYDDFEFTDYHELSTQGYTHHFVWCCFAIAWGVRKYYAAQSIAEAKA